MDVIYERCGGIDVHWRYGYRIIRQEIATWQRYLRLSDPLHGLRKKYRAIDYKKPSRKFYSSLRAGAFDFPFFIRDMINMVSGITTNTGIYIKGTMFFAT